MALQKDQEFALARLINEKAAADAKAVPPKIAGAIRISPPKRFKILRELPYYLGTEFTLSWLRPDDVSPDEIDHYNIYVKGHLTDQSQFQGPFAAAASPCAFRLQTDISVRVVFAVQTVLKNGLMSDLEQAPTTSGVAWHSGIPSSALSPIALTAIETGTAGQVLGYDATTFLQKIGPGAANQVLRGNGAGVAVSFGRWGNTLDVLQVLNQESINIDSGDSPYSAGSVVTINCDTSGGAVTVNLPDGPGAGDVYKYRTYNIRRAGANSVFVVPAGGDTVQGDAAGAELNVDKMCLTLQFDGISDWMVI